MKREEGEAQKFFLKNGSKNLKNLMINTNLYIQEAQWFPKRINSKRSIVRYIIVKTLKTKKIKKKNKKREKISKTVREKWLITYKETPIRLMADF